MTLLALGLIFVGMALLVAFRTERSWRIRRRKPHLIDPDALMQHKNHVMRQTYSYMVAALFCGLALFSGFPGVVLLFFAMLGWGVYLYLMWVSLIESVKHLRTIDPNEYVRQQKQAEFDGDAQYVVGDDGELERVSSATSMDRGQ